MKYTYTFTLCLECEARNLAEAAKIFEDDIKNMVEWPDVVIQNGIISAGRPGEIAQVEP